MKIVELSDGRRLVKRDDETRWRMEVQHDDGYGNKYWKTFSMYDYSSFAFELIELLYQARKDLDELLS